MWVQQRTNLRDAAIAIFFFGSGDDDCETTTTTTTTTMARRQPHLQPLGSKAASSRAKSAAADDAGYLRMKVRPVDPNELTELERRFHLRQDILSSTARVNAIFENAERPTPFAGYEAEAGRSRLNRVLDNYEQQHRRVNESLLELSDWQATLDTVDTAEAAKDAGELESRIASGFQQFQAVDDVKRKHLELLKAACDRAGHTKPHRSVVPTAAPNDKKRTPNSSTPTTTPTTTTFPFDDAHDALFVQHWPAAALPTLLLLLLRLLRARVFGIRSHASSRPSLVGCRR